MVKSKKIYKKISVISTHFGKMRELYAECLVDGESIKDFKNKYVDVVDESLTKVTNSIFWIKISAVLLETILAVRGFDFFFEVAFELNFKLARPIIYGLSFITSFSLIKLSFSILGGLEKVWNENLTFIKDYLPALPPLLVIPLFNFFSFQFDETEERYTLLLLTILILIINLIAVYLLYKITYNNKFSITIFDDYNENKSAIEKLKKVRKKFISRYRMIEDETFDFLNLYENSTIKLNIPAEYLYIIQNIILSNDKIEFPEIKNNTNVENSEFVKWFKSELYK